MGAITNEWWSIASEAITVAVVATAAIAWWVRRSYRRTHAPDDPAAPAPTIAPDFPGVSDRIVFFLMVGLVFAVGALHGRASPIEPPPARDLTTIGDGHYAVAAFVSADTFPDSLADTSAPWCYVIVRTTGDAAGANEPVFYRVRHWEFCARIAMDPSDVTFDVARTGPTAVEISIDGSTCTMPTTSDSIRPL